jgi:hypothetical protein
MRSADVEAVSSDEAGAALQPTPAATANALKRKNRRTESRIEGFIGFAFDA